MYGMHKNKKEKNCNLFKYRLMKSMNIFFVHIVDGFSLNFTKSPFFHSHKDAKMYLIFIVNTGLLLK